MDPEMMRGSTHDSTASSSGCSLSLSSGSGVPAIFLSHSGKQKFFVECLFSALQAANHRPFFDQETLPKGSPFPDRIKRAAKGCELGVVVLSEDFLTSKWPMLELEILVLQRGPEPKVLPLFYELGPDDLRCPENLSRWRKVWEEKAGSRHDAQKWGEAVKALNRFNGVVFIPGSSVVSYINRVVHNICKEMPSPLSQDLTPIKGRHRLAKEVAGRFDHACNSRQRELGACIIGLHGLGGSGKTTICKIMVDFYSVEYLGRCHHLEFPTGGTDTLQIVQGCKQALKCLTNLSDEHILNRVDRFDQVIQLMKQHLSPRDVFLVIDNVWENSLEAARRILEVGFSANSKILLTSRSVQVLDVLLRSHNNACVHPLPALEHDEAFQIFQGAFGEGGDVNSLGSNHLVERIMKRFLFGGNYHALALKALGGHVREGWTPGDWKKNEDFLARLLEQIRNKDLESLDNAIRLSYDILPEHRKHLFLDIVVLRPAWVSAHHFGAVTFDIVHQGLSTLYKDQFSETMIGTLIDKLALDGLVQIETDEDGERIIRVHDLVADLAEREAAASPRFFIDGSSSRLVEEIEWEKLERVILSPYEPQEENDVARFVEKLQRQECRKLQVIHAGGVRFLTGIDMHHMPSLRVLCLDDVTLRRLQNLSAASRLGIVLLSEVEGAAAPRACIPGVQHLYKSSVKVLNLSFLIQLQVLDLYMCSDLKRIQGLDSLRNLQRLWIWRCDCLEHLDGLSSLSRLQALRVESCPRLKTRLPDLSGLACLEELKVNEAYNVEWEEGFSPPALRIVRISSCHALKRTPDFSRSTRLEELELSDNDSLEEVQGVVSSALTDLAIFGCGDLKKVPNDFSGFTRLERLRLGGLSMEELEGLSSTLRVMELFSCKALKRLPSGLTRLETLVLSGNDTMEVGGLSSSLMQVAIKGSKAMKMLDLSGLTRLERLRLECNGSMEQVGGRYVGSTLKGLAIVECAQMQSFPSLRDCVDLREVRASPDAVAVVASSSPPNLHRLTLWGGSWPPVMSTGNGLAVLQELVVKESGALVIDLGCLSPLTNLKTLQVSWCRGLEEIANSGKLQGLERLIIFRCTRLTRLDGFRSEDLKNYDPTASFCLQRCPSLENIHWRNCPDFAPHQFGGEIILRRASCSPFVPACLGDKAVDY